MGGTYWSDDAEVALTAAVDQGQLVLRRRPDTTIALTAIEKDTFFLITHLQYGQLGSGSRRVRYRSAGRVPWARAAERFSLCH